MQLKSTLFILFSLITSISFANNYRDSIGVENLSGKKVIIYKIEPKDNYYFIGRKYGISAKIIMDFNKNAVLNIGTIIRIPTQINFNNDKEANTQTVNNTPAQTESTHIVAKKETLYSICSLYDMKLADLKSLNNLKSTALSIGQTLKVISNKPKQVSENETPKTDTGVKTNEKPAEKSKETNKPEPNNKEVIETDTSQTTNVKEIPRNKYGITELSEKGAAVWIDDKSLDATKSYALHRTAPVGTIIKITNPMSGRSVFAKVVGRYTENVTTKDVIIVVTRATAEAIGVIDKRFYVNIGYGIPNNEK